MNDEVYPYMNRVSNTEGRTSDTSGNTRKPQSHCTKGKEHNTKGSRVIQFIYIENPEENNLHRNLVIAGRWNCKLASDFKWYEVSF
jgi:hypothetical protein